ncbi:MAG: hypothetical protein HYU69_14940 [Bacteroidetes bacterium]|nr:hypothetical protein [Bacteroidota bacterium]
MSKSREKDLYLKEFPEIRKWLNECQICHAIGYKPELPVKIYPRLMAENIRGLFGPLTVNYISICEDCARHWEGLKQKDL